ncbi:PIN domain-like protein [Trametes punicea]|nr:PIN domain-like protein [Trametes punicea]
MPIKHLDSYLSERKHLQTHPLSVLSDSRLGIDASYYLTTLIETPPSREPLLAATGGLPLALTTRLESDLRALEKLRIKPVFVFNGLLPSRRTKQQQQQLFEPPEACKDRREAWAKYEAGQEDAATKLFETRSNLHTWDLWKIVLRIFKHRNVEFIVAPYVAWAQLIYLQRHPKSYIHAIYGPTDSLLYPGVDKLITSVDLVSTNPTFSFVQKRTILNDLGVTEDQFLDIGILLGFEHSPPFPATVHEQALKATVDMVKYYKSGYAAVSALADQPHVKAMQYPELYARTRSMIRYSLILSSEGSVTPLPLAVNTPPSHGHPSHHNHHPTAADIPSDLHEIFTHRSPRRRSPSRTTRSRRRSSRSASPAGTCRTRLSRRSSAARTRPRSTSRCAWVRRCQRSWLRGPRSRRLKGLTRRTRLWPTSSGVSSNCGGSY